MLRRTLSDSRVFVDLIESLLAETKNILKDGVVTIALAPEDLELFEHELQTIIYDKEEIKKLNFIADKTIERGNSRVETSLGLVNFDIKRMLADLEKKIL
jgi:flagellar biosynthesis/type III secretory pathway protein FliH